VRSARTDVDSIDHQEVLRDPVFGLVSVLVEYRVSFFAAFFPQLQLRCFHKCRVTLVSRRFLQSSMHIRVPQVDLDKAARIPAR
jgi:hypothetical protein